MEYAHSLLLGGAPIHARETDYDDCRQFQIICLACKEPVFKVGSVITKRQYFAHYRRQPDSNCELRSMAIVRQYFEPKPVLPKGQELERFLQQFEAIILESSGDTEVSALWRRQIEHMRGRATFRALVRAVRDSSYLRMMTLGGMIKGKEHPRVLEDFRGNTSGEDEVIAMTCEYLLSSNAFRALMFAICFGLLLYRAAYEAEGHQHPRPLDPELVSAFIQDSDAQLKRRLLTAAPPTTDMAKQMVPVFDVAAYGLVGTVLFFVSVLQHSQSSPRANKGDE